MDARGISGRLLLEGGLFRRLAISALTTRNGSMPNVRGWRAGTSARMKRNQAKHGRTPQQWRWWTHWLALLETKIGNARAAGEPRVDE